MKIVSLLYRSAAVAKSNKSKSLNGWLIGLSVLSEDKEGVGLAVRSLEGTQNSYFQTYGRDNVKIISADIEGEVEITPPPFKIVPFKD